jgi:hypothetical protein
MGWGWVIGVYMGLKGGGKRIDGEGIALFVDGVYGAWDGFQWSE